MTALLALDPSLTAFGWAVLELGSTPCLRAAGVIETKPLPGAKRKKAGISVAQDDARRVRFLRRELRAVLEQHQPAIIAVESGFGSQAAKAAKALGQAQAAAACTIDEYLGDGQPLYITVHEAGDAIGIARTQRTVGGKDAKDRAESSKARKAAIAVAVIKRLGYAAWAEALGSAEIRRPRHEGAFDAAAVGLAAWERPEVAAVRRMAAQHNASEGHALAGG